MTNEIPLEVVRVWGMCGVCESGRGRIERAVMTSWVRKNWKKVMEDEQTRDRVDVSKCDEVCGDVIIRHTTRM